MVLIFCALGILGIIVTIDLCEYLKRYHSKKWKEISFERPFGMSQESFPVHPVNPVSLISFLTSSEDLDDNNIQVYRTRLKMLLYAFAGVSLILLLLVIFF
jgi:hypothetical protein